MRASPSGTATARARPARKNGDERETRCAGWRGLMYQFFTNSAAIDTPTHTTHHTQSPIPNVSRARAASYATYLLTVHEDDARIGQSHKGACATQRDVPGVYSGGVSLCHLPSGPSRLCHAVCLHMRSSPETSPIACLYNVVTCSPWPWPFSHGMRLWH